MGSALDSRASGPVSSPGVRFSKDPKTSRARKPSRKAPETTFGCFSKVKGKVKVCIRANVAHQAGAYAGFCSMKRLGVFLLPPGWDASPSQGYPLAVRRYPFIHLGGERHCESKVSCPRTHVPGQGSTPDRSLRSRAH